MLFDGSLYDDDRKTERARRTVSRDERETISRLARMKDLQVKLKGADRDANDRMALRLGVDADGNPVEWKPDYSNLLIAGSWGSGKTVLVRYIVSQLIATPGVMGVLYSGKEHDGEWLERLHAVTVETTTDIGHDIAAVHLELGRRDDERRNGLKSLHPIFLIIDASGTSRFDGDETAFLASMATAGPQLGIHIIATCRGADDDIVRMLMPGDPTVAMTGRHHMDRRVNGMEEIQSLSTMNLSSRPLGMGGVWGPWSRDISESPQYMRIPYVSDKRMKRDLNGYLWQLPEVFRSHDGDES